MSINQYPSPICPICPQMTDFTRKGSLFLFEAQADEPEYFSLIPDKIRKKIRELYAYVGHETQNLEERNLKIGAFGCLERLSACLVQIQRIADHAADIRSKAPMEPGQMIGIRAPKALFDFETLLFHSRSALDRLTFFVCRQVYGEQCDRFSKLQNVINNFGEKDDRVEQMQCILKEASTTLTGTLVDKPDGKRCLRSLLIHRSTIGEICTVGFVLHCVIPGQRLAFDTIILGYPLFETAHAVGSALLFVLLNTLSLYLYSGTRFGSTESILNWSHNFVDFRHFESTGQETQTFSVWQPTPSGVYLKPVLLNKKVCEMAY
jgi:hypothetical protein